MKRKHVEIVAATAMDPVAAAALLIFTKSTRLDMDGEGLSGIIVKCHEDPEWMMRELDYMSKTIRSSWEFLDVTFSLRDVSRACAQQITRTRFTPIDGDLFGSYAMQSQRVTDMSKMGWHNPYDEASPNWQLFEDYMANAVHGHYVDLVDNGSKLEDARGVLPVNLYCNLVAKYNLRMLADLCLKRESYRAQGEFNVIAMEMRSALIEMWPWAELFLRPKNELAKDAANDVRAKVDELLQSKAIDAKGAHELKILVAKFDDIMQGE